MHHIKLDDITLTKGGHKRRDDGVCLLEAVAWWADREHSDSPPCVSLVLRRFGIRLNDVLPDDRRQRLVPLIPRLVGTAGDGVDEVRSYMALDWLIRTWTPTWLDLAGLTAEASALRGLRRIVDLVAAQQAGPVVRVARTKAAAARDAAEAAAEAAAEDAAEDAAEAAAEAAEAAAEAAAEDAAEAAAEAAEAAAEDAAEDAARAAGRAAAEAAGRAAGRAALQPTVDLLQESAIELFTAMIQPALSTEEN